jgi:hypothetical protein
MKPISRVTSVIAVSDPIHIQIHPLTTSSLYAYPPYLPRISYNITGRHERRIVFHPVDFTHFSLFPWTSTLHELDILFYSLRSCLKSFIQALHTAGKMVLMARIHHGSILALHSVVLLAHFIHNRPLPHKFSVFLAPIVPHVTEGIGSVCRSHWCVVQVPGIFRSILI